MPATCPHPPDAQIPRFRAADSVSGDVFTLTECTRCGLVRTQPQPADPGRYYPHGYHAPDAARRFPLWVETLQGLLYRRRAARIARLATGGRPGRVLDIGCGPGLLLRAFRRRGWESCGTEMNETTARGPRQRFGLQVESADVTRLPWPDAHFDAVVLWHVLEHLAEPDGALREAARVLRPGGICLVAVPNFASWEARWARAAWFHLDVPRHLVHFTPATLATAFQRANLAVRHRSSAALEYDAFCLVQSALNRAGLPHNLLYNLLRGRRARLDLIPPGSRTQSLLCLALGLPLGVLALPLGALCALAGHGATLTWTARRETGPDAIAGSGGKQG